MPRYTPKTPKPDQERNLNKLVPWLKITLMIYPATPLCPSWWPGTISKKHGSSMGRPPYGLREVSWIIFVVPLYIKPMCFWQSVNVWQHKWLGTDSISLLAWGRGMLVVSYHSSSFSSSCRASIWVALLTAKKASDRWQIGFGARNRLGSCE